MELIPLLIVLVVLGIFFGFIESQVPMSEPFKLGVRILAVVIVLLVLLRVLFRAYPNFTF